jgi:hypothetical protein
VECHPQYYYYAEQQAYGMITSIWPTVTLIEGSTGHKYSVSSFFLHFDLDPRFQIYNELPNCCEYGNNFIFSK